MCFTTPTDHAHSLYALGNDILDSKIILVPPNNI